MSEEGALLGARWIDKAMKRAGISQSELARRVGVSPSQISKILKGEREASLETVIRALRVCGLEIVELQVRTAKNFSCQSQPPFIPQ